MRWEIRQSKNKSRAGGMNKKKANMSEWFDLVEGPTRPRWGKARGGGNPDRGEVNAPETVAGLIRK